ncbi:MAG: MFS transporter [Anaerolineae bacterium]|nr:MFS transporter [Anaerolineae bacterium]
MQATRRRWSVVAVFFFFMLLHQSDKLLISSLAVRIQETFQITKTQLGAVSTGALIVGAILYPIWGYLYDRFARPKLLALASFIWGATTWLNAIAPTYPVFLVTRASTGIDDSSYPGLYSLVADYFPPKVRGKIYGLLELTMPLGFLCGMVLAIGLGGLIGWRGVFYITGSLGIVLSAVIFFVVREVPRGQSEPELQGVTQTQVWRFSWKTAGGLFRKPSLILLFVQGFFGVFPWNVITAWFLYYLETERAYSETMLLVTMGLAVIVLAAGYPIGGALGDFFFKRSPRGRIIVAGTGVIIGALLLIVTLSIPIANQWGFLVALCLTALFIPFAAPNVLSTVYDVTEPEVRSTAVAVQYFIESAGAALSPLMAGFLADHFEEIIAGLRQLPPALSWMANLFAAGMPLQNAMLLICVTTWVLCAIFFILVGRLIPRDIAKLRRTMEERAALEKAEQQA